MLSHCVSLSFPAMRRAATLPAGTAWARPKQSPGAVAGRPGWRRWPRLCQELCGRDARGPGRLHPMTSSQQWRSIGLRVYLWFVLNNNRQFLPPMTCPAGQGRRLPATPCCTLYDPSRRRGQDGGYPLKFTCGARWVSPYSLSLIRCTTNPWFRCQMELGGSFTWGEGIRQTWRLCLPRLSDRSRIRCPPAPRVPIPS